MNLRSLALSLPFLLAFSTTEDHELVTLYPVGQRLREVSESDFSIEATEASATVNGMELPPEALEQMPFGQMSERTQSSSRELDEVLEVEDGRPVRLRRSFEALTRERTKAGDTEQQEGVLVGETLILQDDDGEVTAEVEGDTEVDDFYLTGYRLTRLVDVLLPDEEVEVGDSWDVDDELLFALAGMDDGPELYEVEEDKRERGKGFGELMRESVEPTCKVTFEKIEERDGLRCAVLAYEVEVAGETDGLDGSVFGAPEDGPEMSGTLTADITIQGHVWHSLEEGRPVAHEGEIGGTLEMTMEMSLEAQGQTFEMRIELTIEASGRGESTWESVGEDD